METKIIKLNNGDELVATVSSTDGEFIKVVNPLKINVYPRYRENGNIEEALWRSHNGLNLVKIKNMML